MRSRFARALCLSRLGRGLARRNRRRQRLLAHRRSLIGRTLKHAGIDIQLRRALLKLARMLIGLHAFVVSIVALVAKVVDELGCCLARRELGHEHKRFPSLGEHVINKRERSIDLRACRLHRTLEIAHARAVIAMNHGEGIGAAFNPRQRTIGNEALQRVDEATLTPHAPRRQSSRRLRALQGLFALAHHGAQHVIHA